jgi:hypothetical protein
VRALERTVGVPLRQYRTKNRHLEADTWAIKERAGIRLGEILAQQKKTIGLNRGAAGSVVTGSKREPLKDTRTLERVEVRNGVGFVLLLRQGAIGWRTQKPRDCGYRGFHWSRTRPGAVNARAVQLYGVCRGRC